MTGEVVEALVEILERLAEAYDMEIDRMEVMEDQVHVFLSVPVRNSPARVMQIIKSISVRELFARFPRVRRKLWGGEFWEDGYFVRSVGDEVTSEIICRYIRYQKGTKYVQLELWEKGF